jgi:hypothetical protein
MDKRATAKRLFLHYMHLALGERYDNAPSHQRFDYDAEMGDAIDLAIDAAKDELRKELQHGR